MLNHCPTRKDKGEEISTKNKRKMNLFKITTKNRDKCLQNKKNKDL